MALSVYVQCSQCGTTFRAITSDAETGCKWEPLCEACKTRGDVESTSGHVTDSMKHDMLVLLSAAQTLRIVQVNNGMSDAADEAWATLNAAHRRVYEWMAEQPTSTVFRYGRHPWWPIGCKPARSKQLNEGEPCPLCGKSVSAIATEYRRSKQTVFGDMIIKPCGCKMWTEYQEWVIA